MAIIESMEDKDFLRLSWSRFKDGDKEAFAFFYNLHIDRLYHYRLKVSNDEDTIKDAIQEVFLDLYLKRAVTKRRLKI